MTDKELIEEILKFVRMKMEEPDYDTDEYDLGYANAKWDVAEYIEELIVKNGYGN